MAGGSTQIGADTRVAIQQDKRLSKMANKAYRAAARGKDPSAYIKAYAFMSQTRAQGGDIGGGIRQSGRETMRPGQLELMRRSELTGNQEIIPGMPSVGADGKRYDDGAGFRTKGSVLNQISESKTEPVDNQAPDNRGIAKNLLDAYDFGGISKEELLEEGLKIGGTKESILERAAFSDNKKKKDLMLSQYREGELTKEQVLKGGKQLGGSEKNILQRIEEEDEKKRKGSFDFGF